MEQKLNTKNQLLLLLSLVLIFAFVIVFRNSANHITFSANQDYGNGKEVESIDVSTDGELPKGQELSGQDQEDVMNQYNYLMTHPDELKIFLLENLPAQLDASQAKDNEEFTAIVQRGSIPVINNKVSAEAFIDQLISEVILEPLSAAEKGAVDEGGQVEGIEVSAAGEAAVNSSLVQKFSPDTGTYGDDPRESLLFDEGGGILSYILNFSNKAPTSCTIPKADECFAQMQFNVTLPSGKTETFTFVEPHVYENPVRRQIITSMCGPWDQCDIPYAKYGTKTSTSLTVSLCDADNRMWATPTSNETVGFITDSYFRGHEGASQATDYDNGSQLVKLDIPVWDLPVAGEESQTFREFRPTEEGYHPLTKTSENVDGKVIEQPRPMILSKFRFKEANHSYIIYPWQRWGGVNTYGPTKFLEGLLARTFGFNRRCAGIVDTNGNPEETSPAQLNDEYQHGLKDMALRYAWNILSQPDSKGTPYETIYGQCGIYGVTPNADTGLGTDITRMASQVTVFPHRSVAFDDELRQDFNDATFRGEFATCFEDGANPSTPLGHGIVNSSF